jgi:hypothetical protein
MPAERNRSRPRWCQALHDSAMLSAGMAIDVQLTLRNDGFAPPFNPREVNLIPRGSDASYVAKLPDDARRFAPGTATTVTRKLCLPTSMAPGTYALLLALADPVPALNARPEYSIRLANQNTWEAPTGYNSVNSRMVSGRRSLLNPGRRPAGSRFVRTESAEEITQSQTKARVHARQLDVAVVDVRVVHHDALRM